MPTEQNWVALMLDAVASCSARSTKNKKQPFTWGDRYAWYTVGGQAVVARKVGYAFDPDQELL